MKTIFLAAVVSLSTLVSFSQKADKLFAEDAPVGRWFKVDSEDYAGVMFFQHNSDEYIVDYLTKMLKEDSVKFNGFKEEVIFSPEVYLLEWEYEQIESKKTTRVTYTKEERYSMITFYEYE